MMPPFMPVPVRPIKTRYGVAYCALYAYCKCSTRAPDDSAERAHKAADLAKRARECAGGR